jgi:hypothetical protein
MSNMTSSLWEAGMIAPLDLHKIYFINMFDSESNNQNIICVRKAVLHILLYATPISNYYIILYWVQRYLRCILYKETSSCFFLSYLSHLDYFSFNIVHSYENDIFKLWWTIDTLVITAVVVSYKYHN